MTASATSGPAPAAARAKPTGHNPWLIAGVVSIATFMEVLDITIANVALLHIAGSLAASIEQSTWILSSYLVANAVVLPVSGWLATVIGRKKFYMGCVATFTLASLLCGLSWNLTSLIIFRVLQGLGGGGLASSEQAILADTFPPEKRGQAFALYGVAVVVAPTLGPTLGGWLTDNASWHWVFFINVPMGLLSLVLVGWLVREPEETIRTRKRLFAGGLKVDFVGFFLVALGLGALEVVLDQGQLKDWFGSPFINTFAIVSALSLLALVFWELARPDPIVDVRLLFTRQFGTCFVMMLVVGVILIGTTQLLPQLMQTELGYTATLAGLAMSPGGLVTMALMPIAGYLSDKVDARYLIAIGLAMTAAAMWYPTGITPEVPFWYAASLRVAIAFGLPFLFLPLTTASYVGLRPDQTAQAAALFNVARNVGGSIGVATTQTLLDRYSQLHRARLSEHLVASSANYQSTIQSVTQYFSGQGASLAVARQQALAWISQTLDQQSTFQAFISINWVFVLLVMSAVPLVLLLKPGARGAPH